MKKHIILCSVMVSIAYLALPKAVLADQLLTFNYLPNSGVATELEWVREYLNLETEDIFFLGKDEGGWNDQEWVEEDGTTHNPVPWTHSILKYGRGGGNQEVPALFLILNENHYELVDFDTIKKPLPDFDRLSHITYLRCSTGEAPAPVPEPATMLLLGFGLIGLAGFGKKFKN